MNLLHKCIRSTKIFALTLSFLSLLIFCFPTAAMAGTATLSDLIKCAEVHNGKFLIDNTKDIKGGIISSAVVVKTTPPNLTGTVDSIVITGPEGIEYDPTNLPVYYGVDLIQVAGGIPADLEPGETRYQAEGSDFIPSEGEFCLDLR